MREAEILQASAVYELAAMGAFIEHRPSAGDGHPTLLRDSPLVICYTIAIEDGHRNNLFGHETW